MQGKLEKHDSRHLICLPNAHYMQMYHWPVCNKASSQYQAHGTTVHPSYSITSSHKHLQLREVAAALVLQQGLQLCHRHTCQHILQLGDGGPGPGLGKQVLLGCAAQLGQQQLSAQPVHLQHMQAAVAAVGLL